MGIRARWDETYQALLPHALRPADELHREYRDAVFHAWLTWHGDTTDEQLDSLVPDDQLMVLRAIERACALAWRDALLGPVLSRHGHENHPGRPFGGPHGLWGTPARSAGAEGFHRPALPRPDRFGVEMPVRPSLRDALFHVVSNECLWTVNDIRDVHTSTAGVRQQGMAPVDRVRETVTRLCLGAWHQEVEVNRRRGWDDAEWWQYLNLESLLPWAAVALGLPGEHPDEYGHLVESVASGTVTSSFEPWTAQALPPGFASALGEECVRLAHHKEPGWGTEAGSAGPRQQSAVACLHLGPRLS
ncbi:hypothetical protein [Streptomyces netropsis]|uniref:Uncharacterized protein n=1 Tax=Streptomyces netropsis TaxID=55404 RepID=A0A7W7LFY6_STRNE|nr:hypothetical protein [Streptomyces netropsis]MBB4888986.1 hypothetical protein [Streptomyces netropsis]GGR11143.1 hypothetical protein GCM10010219_15010 [Streptomyces netropsis]